VPRKSHHPWLPLALNGIYVRDVKTRAARPQDVEFLAGVFLTSMRDAITAARGYWDVGKEDAQFRQQLDLGATRIIQVENVDAGYITTRHLSDHVIEVHTLCVAVTQQGAGLGTLIMRELMQTALSTESSIELSVLKTNPRARMFYARLGFVEIGQSSHHIRMHWPHRPN